MRLESPNLDDRDFEQLLQAAIGRVRQSCPQWTDMSPGDPGVAILEAFAYLTDVMIYRLNRLPAKAYVEFLRLVGIQLYPPSAASVQLCFSLEGARTSATRIAEGTRVSVSRSNGDTPPPVFMTAVPAVIAAGAIEACVQAYNVDFVEAEIVGMGTGEALQTVTLRQPPVVAPIDDFETLIVGVQTTALDAGKRTNMREHEGKRFRIWQEVTNFAIPGDERFFFVIDRVTGVITFSPAIRFPNERGTLVDAAARLAEYPAAGMEIRVWYARGGGPDGNVVADSLTVMKSAQPGISVTNRRPGVGGASAESIENALARGPQAIHSLERAVTARDYEMFAVKNAAAARAKAFTEKEYWAHAVPGNVGVLLVPNYLEIAQRGNGAITAERMLAQESPKTLEDIKRKLDSIKPLGTQCKVSWVRYKTVEVLADIVVYRGESADAVKARVQQNLHDAINPLPTLTNGGAWKFGEPLRASHVYDIILAEPGVSYVERIRFRVDDIPDRDVSALVADLHQRDSAGSLNTFFAAARDGVFRSMNRGESWERMGTFDGHPTSLQVHPERSGLLAVVIKTGNLSGASVHVSTDCGENWLPQVAQFDFNVEDLAWSLRGDKPLLLMATGKGLYEVVIDGNAAVPVLVVVDPAAPELALYAVVVTRNLRGSAVVAVAAQGSRGVHLSIDGGKSQSFKGIGLTQKNVLTLAIQADGPRSFLWAGLGVPGNAAGDGAFRWEITGSIESPEGWRQFRDNWVGGTCLTFGFAHGTVYAATQSAGVICLDSANPKSAWKAPSLSCGLPTRSVAVNESAQIFFPVRALAVTAEGSPLLVAGEHGVFSGSGDDLNFDKVSVHEFSERVALPPMWLFCSGSHVVNVLNEDETSSH